MALVTRLPHDDSVRRFRAAGRQRYDEATLLSNLERRLAGIYLFGYSAEMFLKAAYFESEGFRPDDPIQLKHIHGAKARAQRLGLLSPPRNLHDLAWWAELLVESKKAASRPYSLAFASMLLDRVLTIDQNWRETLRYRANRPRSSEVHDVFEAAAWLVARARRL